MVNHDPAEITAKFGILQSAGAKMKESGPELLSQSRSTAILRRCYRIIPTGLMINACYNSECRKELRYLREGRIVRIVYCDGGEARLEHFWLCGPCISALEFVSQSA